MRACQRAAQDFRNEAETRAAQRAVCARKDACGSNARPRHARVAAARRAKHCNANRYGEHEVSVVITGIVRGSVNARARVVADKRTTCLFC